MHFFYLDETGCTGADLSTKEQPIFVLGGISVKAQGWRETNDQFRRVYEEFFAGAVPNKFELHATDLLSGKGAFSAYGQEQRNALAHRLLDIIAERKHAIQFVAIDKKKLAAAAKGGEHKVFDCGFPYLLAFNYLVSYIERYVREKLGQTVRGMIILDEKESCHDAIDAITHYRRYEVPKARRLKWLVEFSYPVDSVRHPMIQVSDLVIFLARKFLEMDNGYKPGWRAEAKNFYASCYEKIISRVQWSGLIDVPGAEESSALSLLKASVSTHRKQWKKHYPVLGPLAAMLDVVQAKNPEAA